VFLMKNLLALLGLTAIVCLAIAGLCSAGGWPTHTYEALTNTAWTSADDEPVVVAGTTVVGNYSPICNHFRLWENTKTMGIWHSYSTNLAGAWVYTPAGEVYDTEMNVPKNGVFVYVTSTAKISFESTK
jgi:hypothetical protein